MPTSRIEELLSHRQTPIATAVLRRRGSGQDDLPTRLRLQASTLRYGVNQRDWPGAAQALWLWVYGGGRVLPGLVLRRDAEVSFCSHLANFDQACWLMNNNSY